MISEATKQAVYNRRQLIDSQVAKLRFEIDEREQANVQAQAEIDTLTAEASDLVTDIPEPEAVLESKAVRL